MIDSKLRSNGSISNSKVFLIDWYNSCENSLSSEELKFIKVVSLANTINSDTSDIDWTFCIN